MIKHSLHAILLFNLIFILSGCAVHSPMSEMLMFQKKKGFDGRYYRARYSQTLISSTTNLYPKRPIEQYARKLHPESTGESYDYSPAQTFTTNAILLSDKTDKFAVSLAMGNVLGIDATARIWGNLYFTGTISGYEKAQGQLIVQERILDGNPVGLSVGATYLRNYNMVYTGGSGCTFCYPSTDFYTHSIGIRSLIMLTPASPYGLGRPFLYATGSYNYDITMDLFYPRIGIALGFY